MTYADKDARRAYQREFTAARRAAYMATVRCACGSSEDLELHGADGPKPKGFWNWSAPRREALLATCAVVCAACRRTARSTACPDCGGPVGRGSVRCRSCYAKSPAPPAHSPTPAPLSVQVTRPRPRPVRLTPPPAGPTPAALTTRHRLSIEPVDDGDRPQYRGTCSCGDEIGTYLGAATVEQVHRSVHLGSVLLAAAQRRTR